MSVIYIFLFLCIEARASPHLDKSFNTQSSFLNIGWNILPICYKKRLHLSPVIPITMFLLLVNLFGPSG